MHSANRNAQSSNQSHAPPPNRPAPPRPDAINHLNRSSVPQRPPDITRINNSHHQDVPSSAGMGGGLFSSIKGGAGSFLKNLKDTSSKVMQTVQQSIARTDLDISAITSRIMVMPCPSEGELNSHKFCGVDFSIPFHRQYRTGISLQD